MNVLIPDSSTITWREYTPDLDQMQRQEALRRLQEELQHLLPLTDD